jgi:hypothetical protein
VREDWHHLDEYRVGSAFEIPFRSAKMFVVASNGGRVAEWEHVSASLKNRCPNWEEMSFLKDLFWDDEETVVQFHPKKSEYVNNSANCLHLWKPIGSEVELPPSVLTGIKDLGDLQDLMKG